MLKPNTDIRIPRNETEKHFLLKHVALSLLKTKFSSKFAGTEVELGLFYNTELREKYRDFKWKKKVADAVGIQRKYIKKTKDYEFIVRNIEAKMTFADLENGYCTSGDLNYIITTKDSPIKESDVLPFMGYIEVDLDNLKWENGFVPIGGVEIIREPKRINFRRKKREAWLEVVRDHMLQDYTNDAAFRGVWFYPGFEYKKQRGY
jgi:hypothetical protein